MALVFLDQSTCPICGDVIKESDVFIGFPAFVSNTIDPLYLFNDHGCHEKCVLSHPLGDLAIRLSDRFFFEARPGNRNCVVSGQLIAEPDNYFFTGLITSDVTEPLFEFNFITIDKRNAKLWHPRQDLIEKLVDFKKMGKWKDLYETQYLDKMINELSGKM